MSPAVVETFRRRKADWTRRRSLTFELVVVSILQGHKNAFGNALSRAFSYLGRLFEMPTASGLCQARHKLKPEIFLFLTRAVVERFYTLPKVDIGEIQSPTPGCGGNIVRSKTGANKAKGKGTTGKGKGKNKKHPNRRVVCQSGNGLRRVTHELAYLVWHTHRLLAIDGTKFSLPDTAENRKFFGTATNQHDPVGRAQGQGLVLYDVLNDIGLHAVVDPAQGGKVRAEKALFFNGFIEHTQPNDVLILDRGYAAYSILAYIIGLGRHLVLRLPRSTFKAAEDFWASEETDIEVEIKVTYDQKAFVLQKNLPQVVKVRLVKIVLPNGDTEVLATSLLDKERYPLEELGDVYHQRWEIEGYIDRLKNIFEIERLNYKCREHLLQDFYGILFLSTLESTLTRPDQHTLNVISEERNCLHVKQVNRSVSYVALVDRVISLLADPTTPIEKVLEELHCIFKKSPVLRRPNRQFDRSRRSAADKLLYHQRTKTLT